MRRIWVASGAVVVLLGVGTWVALAAARGGSDSPAAATPQVTAGTTPWVSVSTSPSRTPSSPSSPATPPTEATTATAVPPTTAPTSSASPGSAGSAKAPATVVVTYTDVAPGSGDLEVGAYAAVVEPAGTCSLAATSGARVVTATIAATPDVNTTSCGGLTVQHGQLTSGTWQVRVTYDSPTSHGTSATATVSVP